MVSFNNIKMYLVIVLTILGRIQSSIVSYNRPKFCSNASWNSSAITFADVNVIGKNPTGLFINTKNTVYMASLHLNQVLIWLQGSAHPTNNSFNGLKSPLGIFSTIYGDIYVDNGASNYRVDKLTSNKTNSTVGMYVSGSCQGLFVDINNNLYCSVNNSHQVIMKVSGSDPSTSTLVAGTGCPGAASTMLNHSHGIFVDVDFSLYVADSGNNRIQRFSRGQSNGRTVAGNGTSGYILLSWPTGIVLDADGYLFIVDQSHNRIIGSDSNGFRCLVGCSKLSGPAADQLSSPFDLSFDIYGNLFVTDSNNSRIQKFLLSTKLCYETTTASSQAIVSSTVASATTFIDQRTDSSTFAPATSVPSTSHPPVVSYNRPHLCTNASWNPHGTTFANGSDVASYPYGIFVSTNNTVYLAAYQINRVFIWLSNSRNASRILYSTSSSPLSLFVTTNGDVYVGNHDSSNRVTKWPFNATNSTSDMLVSGSCHGVFVDVNNITYCSLYFQHQVVKKLSTSVPSSVTIVAGTGCSGIASNMLNSPQGIFVDVDFTLYVADSANHRIQRFSRGQSNGITVAGNGISGSILLSWPTGIVLDADGYLFIVDQRSNRIIGSDSNGFRCLVGCSTSSGTAADQLSGPFGLSFDSHGNIFVSDTNNNRTQLFHLSKKSCDVTQFMGYPVTYQNIKSTACHLEDPTTTDQTGSEVSTSQYPISSPTTTASSPAAFTAPSCNGQPYAGIHCNISTSPCDIFKPCQNDGTCLDDNSATLGYTCLCSLGFNGSNCDNDIRLCKSDTCWNDGVCEEVDNTTFSCSCSDGWTGDHCEKKINFCDNVTCLNKGVCRPLFLNFTCECLGSSYSGRFCEITEQKAVLHQAVSKSFGYIAIISLGSIISFIVVMDVLKYGFGIDPAKDEREKLRRVKLAKKRKRPPVVQRFIYVDHPSSTIAETRV